jgi:hypothetical protein
MAAQPVPKVSRFATETHQESATVRRIWKQKHAGKLENCQGDSLPSNPFPNGKDDLLS